MQIKTPFFPGDAVEVKNTRIKGQPWEPGTVRAVRAHLYSLTGPDNYFFGYDVMLDRKGKKGRMVRHGLLTDDVRKPAKTAAKK